MAEPDPGFLTPNEHEIIETAGRLMGMFVRMAGDNPHQPDLDEVCSKIHDLQHVAMAQAAARAYPDKYRLFGQIKWPVRTQEGLAREDWPSHDQANK